MTNWTETDMTMYNMTNDMMLESGSIQETPGNCVCCRIEERHKLKCKEKGWKKNNNQKNQVKCNDMNMS